MSKLIQIREYEQQIAAARVILRWTTKTSAIMVNIANIQAWENELWGLHVSQEVEKSVSIIPISLCDLIAEYL